MSRVIRNVTQGARRIEVACSVGGSRRWLAWVVGEERNQRTSRIINWLHEDGAVGGETGIRTLRTLARSTVFKTVGSSNEASSASKPKGQAAIPIHTPTGCQCLLTPVADLRDLGALDVAHSRKLTEPRLHGVAVGNAF